MGKVTVSFDIETSRLNDLEAFLNGTGSSKGKSGRGKKEDPESEFGGAEETDEMEFSFDDSEEEDTTVTRKKLLEMVKERVDAKKQTALGKLFSAYKIKNVSALKEPKFEAFYKDLQKIKI